MKVRFRRRRLANILTIVIRYDLLILDFFLYSFRDIQFHEFVLRVFRRRRKHNEWNPRETHSVSKLFLIVCNNRILVLAILQCWASFAQWFIVCFFFFILYITIRMFSNAIFYIYVLILKLKILFIHLILIFKKRTRINWYISSITAIKWVFL